MFRFLPYTLINKFSNHFMTRHNKKESKFVTSYSSGFGYKKQRMSKEEIYGDGVEVLLEGRKFMATTNYDQYLKNLYGDYMKFPPVEKRVCNHRLIEVDLGYD